MKKRSMRGLIVLFFCLATLTLSAVNVHAALYRKTTATVNIRSAANTTDSASVVGSVPKGATVELIGRSSKYPNWFYIGYNGKKGFVLGSYLTSTTSEEEEEEEEEEDDDDDSDVKTVSVNLNFRSSPKILSTNIIRVLSKGEKVTVLAQESGSWVKVRDKNGRTGYVSGSYLTSGSSSSSSGVSQTTAVALNLRRTPEIKSNNVIRVIPANKTVQVLGTSGNWYRVKYSGSTGYVKSGYFKSETSSSGVKETVNANLRLRSSPKINSENIMTTIPKGTTITVLKEVSGYWFYVQYGSRKGYVKGGYFKSDGSSSSSSDDTMTTTANVRLRSSRSTSSSSNIIDVIPKNTKVKVTVRSDGWCRVSYGGVTGYVSEDYLR